MRAALGPPPLYQPRLAARARALVVAELDDLDIQDELLLECNGQTATSFCPRGMLLARGS